MRPKEASGGTRAVFVGADGQGIRAKEFLAWYSDVVRQDLKADLVKAIRLAMPSVRDVELLADERGETYLRALTETGKRRLLGDLGDGVATVERLLLGLLAARGGVALSDEIERGQHYTILPWLWIHVRKWMKRLDVQLVATTHSHACVRAAIGAFEEDLENLGRAPTGRPAGRQRPRGHLLVGTP